MFSFMERISWFCWTLALRRQTLQERPRGTMPSRVYIKFEKFATWSHLVYLQSKTSKLPDCKNSPQLCFWRSLDWFHSLPLERQPTVNPEQACCAYFCLSYGITRSSTMVSVFIGYLHGDHPSVWSVSILLFTFWRIMHNQVYPLPISCKYHTLPWGQSMKFVSVWVKCTAGLRSSRPRFWLNYSWIIHILPLLVLDCQVWLFPGWVHIPASCSLCITRQLDRFVDVLKPAPFLTRLWRRWPQWRLQPRLQLYYFHSCSRLSSCYEYSIELSFICTSDFDDPWQWSLAAILGSRLVEMDVSNIITLMSWCHRRLIATWPSFPFTYLIEGMLGQGMFSSLA